jgi:hypothetical protein
LELRESLFTVADKGAEYGITFPISGLGLGYYYCREDAIRVLPEDSDVRNTFVMIEIAVTDVTQISPLT